MRGLDNYIMGINDHSAPFNQVEWTDDSDLNIVFEESDWITDKMLESDKVYDQLGKLFIETVHEFINQYFSGHSASYNFYGFFTDSDKIEKELLLRLCAKDISNEIKEKYFNN